MTNNTFELGTLFLSGTALGYVLKQKPANKMLYEEFDAPIIRSSIWSCEYGCPEKKILGDGKTHVAVFELKPGILRTNDTWKKIFNIEKNILSYGYYSLRFMVDRVPSEATTYLGIALWEIGGQLPGAKPNEISLNYWTSGGRTNLDLFTQKEGIKSTKACDPSADLTNAVLRFHSIDFIYQPGIVTAFFDGIFVGEKKDNIPDGNKTPMSLFIGTRVADGSLISNFKFYVNYTMVFAEIK